MMFAPENGAIQFMNRTLVLTEPVGEHMRFLAAVSHAGGYAPRSTQAKHWSGCSCLRIVLPWKDCLSWKCAMTPAVKQIAIMQVHGNVVVEIRSQLNNAK